MFAKIRRKKWRPRDRSTKLLRLTVAGRAAAVALHRDVLLILVAAGAKGEREGELPSLAKDGLHVRDLPAELGGEFLDRVVGELLVLGEEVVAREDVVTVRAEDLGREARLVVVGKGEVGDGTASRVVGVPV